MNRYTQRSHWEDGHWCVPLVQFADEKGNVPCGQYVPQVVIDRLANYEDIAERFEYEHVTAESAQLAAQVERNITFKRFKDIMEAEFDGRLVITPKKEKERENGK